MRVRLLLSRLTLTLFACALALRVLIAPGLMPMASGGGVGVQMCSGQTGGDHGQPVAPCPFEAMAAPAMPEAPPAFIARPLAPRAPPAPSPVPVERGHGPPPPTPPATGPPARA